MNISPLAYRIKQTAAKSRNFDSVCDYFKIPEEVRATPEAAIFILASVQKLERQRGAYFANGKPPIKQPRWMKVKAFLKKLLF